MRIEELEFHAPASLAEVSVLLKELGGDAKVMAGGTDVLADLKQGLITTRHLVSLCHVEELKRIQLKKDGLWIGALVTPNQVAEDELINRMLTGLADAGASMAGMQIRNLATLGGNLCSAVPSADLPPSLLTADAELLLAVHDGERRIPLKSFFLAPRKTAIRDGEVLAAVFVPTLPPATGTAYRKFQLRGASALAVVGVAARLTLVKGTIENARIAISASAPTPLLVEEAGAFLEGKEPLEEHFIQAGALARKGVSPITDLRGSDEYRRDLAGVLTVRALKTALGRIPSQGGISS
jgi:carbon-monoxide dehydrogenase medium subunit